MTDLATTEAPEIDVDAMTDEEFASFKGSMLEDKAPEAKPQEPTPADSSAPAVDANAAPAVDDHDDDEPVQRSESVSFDRFHRTNERRKEAERKAQEATERAIRMEERLAALLEVQQQAQPKPDQAKKPEDDIPDDNDPVAIVNWAKKELLARKERERVEAEQRETQSRQQHEWQQVFQDVNAKYATATKTDPLILDAHNALRKSIGEELLAVGYTQADALKEIERIENQHLAYIHQSGQDVGTYIKRLAGARGWVGKAPEPQPAQDMETVAKREEARQASMSLGKTPGAAVNMGKITPQQLADMSDADFAAYKEKYGSVIHAFQ